jgi:hypothetical protein
MSVHRFELIINNSLIVNSLDNNNFTVYIFQNPVSIDGNDKLTNKIKTMSGTFVILNISSKVGNIKETDYNDNDIFNIDNINIIKKYIENPKCIKIIIAIGEYLRRKFKNKFNYIYYDIIKILEPYENKLFCYSLTSNFKLPYLGNYIDILDKELIPYKISPYLFGIIDIIMKNKYENKFIFNKY